MIIYEGGNIFKDENKQPKTQRIVKADVAPTVKWLEYITRLPLMDNMLGTTGRKETSGDLDLAVDESKIGKDDLIHILTRYITSINGTTKEYVKKSGDSVHFLTPIKGNPKNGYVQTDFMFGDPPWMKFSMMGGADNSQFKGMHRAILLASVCRQQGYKWSYKHGLLDGSTNAVISNNPNVIAKKILSPASKASDLVSVESIINVIKNRPDYEELVQVARENFSRDNLSLPGKTNESISALRDKLTLLEAEARIQHVEDYVFWRGIDGANFAIHNLLDLADSTKDLTVKWDGSPAVYAGRMPDGKFVFTDKSGFSAKGYNGKVTSPIDLKNMILGRGKAADDNRVAFANAMASAWTAVESAFPPSFRGFVKGDLLYLTRPKVSDGHYVFTPNLVTYHVPVDSHIGQKITHTNAGLVVHRYMKDAESPELPIPNLSSLLRVDRQLLVIGPTSVESEALNIDHSKINKLKQFTKKHTKDIEAMLNKDSLTQVKIADLPSLLYTYVNARTKSLNLSNLATEFSIWLDNHSITDVKKRRILDYLEGHKIGFASMFVIYTAIMEIKNEIIEELDSFATSVKASIHGKSGGEGYVKYHPDGDMKLVDRMKFSAANFAKNNPK